MTRDPATPRTEVRMPSNRALATAMGIVTGLVAGAAFIMIDLVSASSVSDGGTSEVVVYLAGAALAGVLGSVLAGWREWAAILGAVTGAALATALFYTGMYSLALRHPEARWIWLTAALALGVGVVVGGRWVRARAG